MGVLDNSERSKLTLNLYFFELRSVDLEDDLIRNYHYSQLGPAALILLTTASHGRKNDDTTISIDCTALDA